ncbi:MAG: tetratricopeptide repeat protein, partial [Bacteroidota bacterium]
TLAALAALIFTACASSESASTEPRSRPAAEEASGAGASGPDAASAPTDEEVRARSYFIRGISALELDELERAENHLLRAHEVLPNMPGVNYALSRLYQEKEDLSSSLFYGRRAVELAPEDKWYRLQLVEALRASGEYREVIGHLDTILTHHPSDIQVLYTKARIQSSQGNYQESNETYQHLLDLLGPDRSIFYQRISNFTRLEDTDAIIDELLKVLELDQGNVNTLLMLSQFYLEEDRTEEATKMLEKVLRRNPKHPEALVNLADIHILNGKWDRAGDLLTGLVGDPEVTLSNKLEAVQYVLSRFSGEVDNDSLKATAGSLIDTLLAAEPENGMTHAMAAEYYLAAEESAQSLQHLQRTIELMPENEAAWRQLIQTYYIEGMYDEAIEAAHRADEFIPQDAFILFFLGGSYFLQDRHEEALRWLSAAADLPARPPFRSIIFGTLGDLYATLDDWKKADTAYEEAITQDPENDMALNNYAYYLTERGRRLNEAKDMAARALELNPGNAAFLDTMGWVYYQMGEYEKAKEYIRASIETGEASADVMEHMGDVYDKLGESDRALYWWQKAYENDTERTHLRERLHIN